MLVMTVNSGSTSVKLGAFIVGDGALSELKRAHHSGEALDPEGLLAAFARELGGRHIDATAHRVVHGGTRFTKPVRIDNDVMRTIADLCDLAPLHNPGALRWIEAARNVCASGTEHVAAFDTAFFSDLPRVAAEYAIPAAFGTRLGVKRYGFHGLAHEAMWMRWRELNPSVGERGRIITLQLGGGCSMAAIDGGRPIDTSMGFSPLEGLVMGTRSGDIDPAAVPYLARRLGRTCDEIVERLNRDSGLLGVSGRQASISELVADPSPDAQLAVDLFCYRARKYIGGYLVALGGCDAIVFGGGIGEHVPEIRERILRGMRWLGIDLEPEANARARGSEAVIGARASPVSVCVIPVDEETVLARAARSCLLPAGSAGA